MELVNQEKYSGIMYMKIKHPSSSINEKDYKYIKNVFNKNFVGEGEVVVLLEKK